MNVISIAVTSTVIKILIMCFLKVIGTVSTVDKGEEGEEEGQDLEER